MRCEAHKLVDRQVSYRADSLCNKKIYIYLDIKILQNRKDIFWSLLA